ncbi:hypothetical protein CIL05_18125 [Virgibacillus profundi]|uniref:Uncharacterized protein n=1 Tax=Virgibacillus profundi TaxID=2024555 RepID=A0A2A2IAW4_9BACI|nr:DUF4173 domain-containing protein [Virgibacillus profundi]PAV28285.1 hypothetical protein CIL05_18125 [Virgibacillus profundi]PXY52589.1 DUF4173 domain-containing protein [Virgibacillus profundi]
MEIKIGKKDWMFLIVCLALGILAEASFFHGEIGLSYLVFIAGFYLVLFLRYRLAFQHRRIGLLLMVAIWILAGSYAFYDNVLFYNLNLIIIPILVYFHIVLITRPNQLNWATPGFVKILGMKLSEGKSYCAAFFNKGFRKLFKNMDEELFQTMKRVLIGLTIGAPLLLVITGLLMSADAVFQDVILRLPQFILSLNFLEGSWRVAVVLFLTLLFFAIFQVLHVKSEPEESFRPIEKARAGWNSITVITILIMLNAVYVLFAAIQFQYFFGEGLQEGYTFAEYARKGFFELIVVTLINWSILIACLKFVKESHNVPRLTLKIMYSLLILVSGIMLASAFGRLSLYEAAYGYTLDRLLAHAFMILLIVIFAYTFIRVWLERLSLLHFYIIAGLLFYTGVNAVNMEQIVVDNNLKRYEESGKIDIYYLNSLSYTGLTGLIELYKIEQDYPELKRILNDRQQWGDKQPEDSWQSFNFTKQEAKERLKELKL